MLTEMEDAFFIPPRRILSPQDQDWVFPFFEGKVATSEKAPYFLKRKQYTEAQVKGLYFGDWNGASCFAIAAKKEEKKHRWVGLRDLFTQLPVKQVLWAGRGQQILQWVDHHRYCGRCSHSTELSPTEWMVHCPNCGLDRYPRINPAVIVAITKGQEVLLVRKDPKVKKTFYSLVAGFVESGEDLEEAVKREVREEVGLEIKNIQYIKSQSWPFPDALMLGFRAEYASGSIEPDGVEIHEAQWFSPLAPPSLPPGASIATQILANIWNLEVEDLLARQVLDDP